MLFCSTSGHRKASSTPTELNRQLGQGRPPAAEPDRELCWWKGSALPLSNVIMHAVSVTRATITSHGCDAQNSPCARNNRPTLMFLQFEAHFRRRRRRRFVVGYLRSVKDNSERTTWNSALSPLTLVAAGITWRTVGRGQWEGTLHYTTLLFTLDTRALKQQHRVALLHCSTAQVILKKKTPQRVCRRARESGLLTTDSDGI